MSAEYEGKLISELYSLKPEGGDDAMVDILHEIGDMKSGAFLYPLKDAYLRWIEEPISHYFVSALGELNTAESIPVLEEILVSPQSRDTDKNYVVDIFARKDHFTDRATQYAEEAIITAAKQKGFDLSYYTIEDLVEYLEKAKKTENILAPLQILWRNKQLGKDARASALKKIARLQKIETLDWILENYPNLDDQGKILVTKEFMGWTGTKVDALKVIIVKHRGRPAEILEDAQKKLEQENKKNKAKEEIPFSNAKLVDEIRGFRQQVNSAALLNDKLNIELLLPSDLLAGQFRAPTDREALRLSCVDLRAIITGISSEAGKHGLSVDEMKIFRPSVQESDLNKSLNRLYFCLKAKGFQISEDFFGINKLNNLLGLLGAHPDANVDLIKLLKELKLDSLYNDQKWTALHKEILNRYKLFLVSVIEAINHR
jgi:hypothetical protein